VKREEAVIRTRFEIYMGIPARKIATLRPPAAIVDEIVVAHHADCSNLDS
jgi:hypothetical protein